MFGMCVCIYIYVYTHRYILHTHTHIYMVLYMVDILQSNYFYLKHKNISVQYCVMTVILVFYT